jgi:hypothetical protein
MYRSQPQKLSDLIISKATLEATLRPGQSLLQNHQLNIASIQLVILEYGVEGNGENLNKHQFPWSFMRVLVTDEPAVTNEREQTTMVGD